VINIQAEEMEGKGTTRGGSTHDKVDSNVDHARHVDCQASEPFGGKRYPPANTRICVNHPPVPRGEMVATYPPESLAVLSTMIQ
jgi:hypothetical protein